MEIIVFDDNHLQVNEYLPKSVDEHDLFWQGLKNDYLGYSIDFCYYNNDDVIFSGIIEAGNEKWEDLPTPVFSIANSEYKEMLTNVRVRFFPG